ncbi:MAG: TlpA family protein disulfide reductase, partial [Prevotella salivae]|nr:TlpA family protein disulfide reductase [Segatella salivae]
MRKILLFLCLLPVCLGSNAQGRLPKITLKDIEGRTIQTDTLSNNGKPFMIAFFATWCKPCNRELKTIDELYDEWRQETGVRIIAVAVDEGQNINKVKPLVDQNGWRYDVLLDPNSELR